MSGEYVLTLYAYNGEEGINFEAGQEINVIEKGDNGWWKGNFEKDGRTVKGWFPASYVKIKSDENKTCHGHGCSRLNGKQALLLNIPPPVKKKPQQLPEHWRRAKTEDGKIYYYNDITKETSWIAPVVSAPLKENGNLIVRSLSVSPTSPTSKDHILPQVRPETRSFSGTSTKTADSGYSGSTGSPSPYSSRESIETKSVGSTGSPAGRKKKNKQMAQLTPVRAPYFHYPSIEESKEQAHVNHLQVSYCDHFWEDIGDATGFDVVVNHIHRGRSNCKEMAEFFRERATIEDLYARNLVRLSRSPLGDQEQGTAGDAWQRLKKGLEEEANSHHKFSQMLLQGIEKSLMEFADGPTCQRKDFKKLEAIASDDRKLVSSKFKEVEKQRGILSEKHKSLEAKQTGAVPVKSPQDITKAQKKAVAAAEELKKVTDNYNQAQRKWVENTILALMELEREESERIEFVKKHLDHYIQLGKSTMSSNSQSYTHVLEKIDKIDHMADREDFVKQSRTGSIRPVDVKL